MTLTYRACVVPTAKRRLNIDFGIAQIAGQVMPAVNLRTRQRFAAASEHTIVCKSMSKVYALSGMRVAFPVRLGDNSLPGSHYSAVGSKPSGAGCRGQGAWGQRLL
jgi:hypothetical protein